MSDVNALIETCLCSERVFEGGFLSKRRSGAVLNLDFEVV